MKCGRRVLAEVNPELDREGDQREAEGGAADDRSDLARSGSRRLGSHADGRARRHRLRCRGRDRGFLLKLYGRLGQASLGGRGSHGNLGRLLLAFRAQGSRSDGRSGGCGGGLAGDGSCRGRCGSHRSRRCRGRRRGRLDGASRSGWRHCRAAWRLGSHRRGRKAARRFRSGRGHDGRLGRASGRGRRNRRGLRSGRRRSHRRLGQNGCCRSGGCRCDRRSWRRRRLDASRRRHGRSRCCTGSGWGRGFRHGLGRKVDHRGFARIRGKRLTVPARGEDDAYGFLLRFVSHRTLFWGSRIKLTCR